MSSTESAPITDADLAWLFASCDMRRANHGLLRLHSLLSTEPASGLLRRVAEILVDGEALHAHRSVFVRLCGLAARPSDDASLGRSEFSQGNMDEGPHAVAQRLLGEQQALLQILERWGDKAENPVYLAEEGSHDYTTLRTRFLGSYFGEAAPSEPHKPSEQWMADRMRAARHLWSGDTQDTGT